MRITADTNLLVRAIVDDDARQSRIARAELAEADLVAVPLTALCELVWVMSRGYRITSREIADAIRRLINSDTVAVNRAAVETGLSLLDAGGDFADGVIAHEGAWLGGETFVSFDKTATHLLQSQGLAVRVLV